MTLNRLAPVGLSLAFLLWGAAGAGAHAFLERADPRVGSTVRSSPAQVKLWFTESLEPTFCSVQVVNEAGKRIDKDDSQVDPSNLALLRISLPSLTLGTYKVIWRVLSVDGHVTDGDFTFRITQ